MNYKIFEHGCGLLRIIWYVIDRCYLSGYSNILLETELRGTPSVEKFSTSVPLHDVFSTFLLKHILWFALIKY